MRARSTPPSKRSRRAKSAQAAATAVQVMRARSTRVESRHEACEECTSCINGSTSNARQEYKSRVNTRGVRRVHKLQHWWHRQCAPGAQANLNKLGVCIYGASTNSTAVTTLRSSLSVKNYQDGGQRSTCGEAGLKIRRQECERLSGMIFQTPRQPVALQQVDLRNRTRVAATIRLG